MKNLSFEEKQVLYIDDEPENLDGFKYTFRKDYHVFSATNETEAYNILDKHDIKVVIADQRMPDTKGTDLLERISITHPNIIRIILTAYAEVEVIKEAVNKGKVYRFLTKPWDRKELFNALENAIETWTLRNENNKLIENLHSTNKQLKDSNKKLKAEIEARKKAQQQLNQHKEHLEYLVKERTEEVEQINEELTASNEELLSTVDELNNTNAKLKNEIEQRTTMQDNLEESEEKFRRFLEQSTDSITLINKDGYIIEWNKGSEHLFGLKKEEVLGKYVAEVDYSLQPPENQTQETYDHIFGTVRDFLKAGIREQQMLIDTEIVDAKGIRKYITNSIFYTETSKGGFIGRITKDITIRKQMEDELKKYQEYLESLVEAKTRQIKENEDRLTLVLNSVPLAFYILPAYEVNVNSWLSSQVKHFTGFTNEDFYNDGELWLKQLHEDDKEYVLNEFESLHHKKQISTEYRWKGKDGKYRWFLDQAKLIEDDSGEPLQIIGVWIDVTERKKTEMELQNYQNHLENLVTERTEELELVNEELKSTNEELYEKNEELQEINEQLQDEINHRVKIQEELEINENMFRSFLEQSSDGISLITADGEIIEWNLALERMTGIGKQEVLQKKSWDIEYTLMIEKNKTPQKKASIKNSAMRYLKQVYDEYKVFTHEGYIVDGDNREKYIQMLLFPIKTKDKLYVGKIFRDITEKRQKDIELENYRNKLEQLVEERTFQLKQSEEKFSKVFKYNPSYVVVSSLDKGKFIDVSDAFLEDFGYRKEEVIGKTAYELNIIDKKTREKNARILIENSFYENLEVNLKTRHGQILHCISSGEIIEINNEQLIVQVITDISEMKMAELEIKTKNQELLAAEEELRSANEELRTVNDELQDRNILLEEANKQIAENEERFRSLFEQAVDGILVGDKDGTIIDANSFMSRMTGYTKNEIIGKKLELLFSGDILEEKPLRYDLLNAGIVVHREREIITKNGTRIPVEMNTKRLSDGRLQSFFRDVSERVKAEQALKESEEKYRTLIEGQTELVVKINVKGEFLFVSPSYCRTFGKTEEELLGNTFMPLVHEQDRSLTEETMKNLYKPPYKAYIEQRALTKNGWRWIAWSDSAILNDNNEVIEIIGVGRDITKRKQYEEDLVKTNNLLAAINNATPDVVFVLNLVEWKFEYYNQRFNELFQYTDEEIKHLDNIVLHMVCEEDHELTTEHFTKLLEAPDSEIISTEVRLRQKNGNIKWSLVRELVFERDLEGNPVKSVGVITDITERKQSEHALKESESKFRLLFENANDAIFLMKNEVFISCNKKTLEVFRCTSDDILGHTPYEFSPEVQPSGNASKDEAIKRITHALRGNTKTFEWKHMRSDGSLFDAEVSLNSLKLNNELILQAIVRDVSERKKAEMEIREREALLNSIINNLPFDFWSRDSNGTLILQNEYSKKLWGDIKNTTFDNEKVPKKIKADWVQTFELGLQGEVVNEEFDYENINGSCIQKIVAPIVNKNQIQGVLGFDIDITERKKAEKKLIDSEKKFKNIFNNSSDAIAITDSHNQFIEINDVFMRMAGMEKRDILQMKFIDFIDDEYNHFLIENIQKLTRSKHLQSFELNFISENEESIPVEITCKMIDFEGKKAVLSVLRDITERKNTEKKVLDAIIITEEKEREKFAKNLHDDLGPLLSSIRMYLNSFLETDNQKKQQYIIKQINDILKESIQTTKQISNDLSPHILANYGLVSAVETFIDRLSHHLKIDFEHNLKDRRFNSSIEITFYRIIKELINNTIKHASAKNVHIHLYAGKEQLHLDYTDDGIGFDKTVIDKVEKRGMGLFNLISRIKSLNGKFNLGDTDKGVRINIEVPIHQ